MIAMIHCGFQPEGEAEHENVNDVFALGSQENNMENI